MCRSKQALIIILILTGSLSVLMGDQKADLMALGDLSAEELIVRADARQEARDLDAALQLYIQATDVDPGVSMGFRGAGYTLILMDRQEEAIPYLQEALRIDPAAHQPWENLGLAYAAVYDQTSRKSRELAKTIPGGPVTPDSPWHRVRELGAMLEEKDWQGEAIACLWEAVRVEPNRAIYWYNLGNVLKRYRRIEVNEYINAYLKAVELDDSYYPALINVTLALKKRGRNREARNICMRLEQILGADDSFVAQLMGDIEYEDGYYDAAEQRYLKLIELEPDSLHGHISLAKLYLVTGELEKIRVHTEKAVALRPDSAGIIRSEIEGSL